MEQEARPTICVDREEYEKMKTEIEALREQVQTLHLNNYFGLQRFGSSPEDIFTPGKMYNPTTFLFSVLAMVSSLTIPISKCNPVPTFSLGG